MRAKVVHLTSVHAVTDNRILLKECVSLASAGYSVSLVVPMSGGDRTHDGVRLCPVPLPRSRRERFSITIPAVYRKAVSEDADVYHFHDPELMPVGVLLAMRGRSVVYDVHEDYAGSMAGKQWLLRWMRPIAARGVRACESLLTRHFDCIVAATPKIAALFPSGKVTLVQNFPRMEELTRADATPYASREPRAVYVGTLSADRGLKEMTEAIPLVNRNTPVTLITAGTLKAGAAGTLQTASSQISHMGQLGRAEVADLLATARLGVVTLHATANYVASQPTKLYEYMAAGLPVVASDFPVWRKIVDGAGCGLLVNPGRSEDIARAIEWLLVHPNEAEAMGRAGQRAFLEKYSWCTEEQRLLAAYAELAPKALAHRAVTRDTRITL